MASVEARDLNPTFYFAPSRNGTAEDPEEPYLFITGQSLNEEGIDYLTITTNDKTLHFPTRRIRHLILTPDNYFLLWPKPSKRRRAQPLLFEQSEVRVLLASNCYQAPLVLEFLR